jgi:hypothetical protein
VRRGTLARLAAVVALGMLVLVWLAGSFAGGSSALDDCTLSSDAPREATTVRAEFNGWAWTCIYGHGDSEVRQRGSSIWEFAQRLVG